MKKLLLILFSISLVSCLSLSLTIDEEAAKSIADAINNSNKKELHIMKSSSNDMGMLGENVMIIRNSDDMEWVGDNGKKIKRVMVKGEKFGKGPNAPKYMDDIPGVIIRRIEKANEKGIDIKIDTIISENGERKEIKIEVKAGNN